jgi:2-polyprenyl-3-methyl-5-hydroxy-6-metoxy-1,4-benzoquinol methylase
MKYQRDYSRYFPEVKDVASRQRKAAKILASLREFWRRESFDGLTCLDLGCSVGVISDTLANAGAKVIGLDIDEEAILQNTDRYQGAAQFILGDVGSVPFPDGVFDIIVCAQVYEHSPSLELLAREITRLLKVGGVCFFSGPNRWAIVEEHYDLPFLSWLPRKWSDWLVQFTGRGTEYYEQPRSADELRQVLQPLVIRDLAPNLLTHPERYGMESEVKGLKYLARCVPRWGWPFLGACTPNFNWLLIRTEG